MARDQAETKPLGVTEANFTKLSNDLEGVLLLDEAGGELDGGLSLRLGDAPRPHPACQGHG